MNYLMTKEDMPLFTAGQRFVLSSIFLREGMEDMRVTFDLLVRELPNQRNYLVFVGLKQIVDFIKSFKFTEKHLKWIKKEFNFSKREIQYFKNFKFSGDIYAMPEGTIFFPNEPVIRISGPLIEVQFIEHFVINQVYLQTILASKISRLISAGGGKDVVTGFNRSYGMEAAIKSNRINEIFGNPSTISFYNYRQKSSAWSAGTYHYFIMCFTDESKAFRTYLRHTKGKGYILIDTYDSIEGIKKFAKVAKELEVKEGIKATGIQLDSGDIFSLSKKAREMLDQAGLSYVKIFAMSNLDEIKVRKLELKKAPIDVYAGTTGILTPEDAPTLELVFKLSETEHKGKVSPKSKTSPGKLSLPGKKQVYRILENGKYLKDIIGLETENIIGEKLLEPIVVGGKLVQKSPDILKIKKYYFAEKEKFDSKLFDVLKKYDYKVEIGKRLQHLTEKTISLHKKGNK